MEEVKGNTTLSKVCIIIYDPDDEKDWTKKFADEFLVQDWHAEKCKPGRLTATAPAAGADERLASQKKSSAISGAMIYGDGEDAP